MRPLIVAGTRPEIIKMAPVMEAFKARGVDFVFVHSGQHYDLEMSRVFIEELGLPEPDLNLEVGSGTHAYQTAHMLLGYEEAIRKFEPDLTLAEGDTNTVVAMGLASIKLRVPFGHVEAGLRCYDRTMPEEINRVIADHCAELCFAPTERAARNLCYEGIPPKKIHVTGNTVVDACLKYALVAEEKSRMLDELELERGSYVLLTLHRAENVDRREVLGEIMAAILELSKLVPIVYPVHPRTRKRLQEFGMWKEVEEGLKATKPLGYFDFLALLKNCLFVMTDSGGVQEEAVTLKIPCLTLRNNTERPETVEVGANVVVGTSKERILKVAKELLEREELLESMRAKVNPLGDGKAGERIADICLGKEVRVEPSFFLRKGSASFAMVEISEEIRVEELERKTGCLVTLAYDEKGFPLFPKPNNVLKKGYRVRLFGELIP